MLDDFIAASQRREEAFQILDQPLEEEDAPAAESRFSIRALVEERSPNYVRQAIKFSWDEFLQLYQIAEPFLLQVGRGRRRTCEPIDRFFVFLLYTTSGFAPRFISFALHVSIPWVQRAIAVCVKVLPAAFEHFFPKSLEDIHCDDAFIHFPQAFAIVDASPIFVTCPSLHQEQYYSGKFKRHCVKVQALITPDGHCAHLSAVFRGATHDKAIFDRSGATEFVTFRDENGRERQKVIMADLGYVGITRVLANAVLPHKRPRGGALTEAQIDENRRIASDRILVENFFGRWKSLFGIWGVRYRGDLGLLSRIVRVTVALTSWYIGRHPLRAQVGGQMQVLSDDEGEPVLPAFPLDAPDE
jgi:hypothetical protein